MKPRSASRIIRLSLSYTLLLVAFLCLSIVFYILTGERAWKAYEESQKMTRVESSITNLITITGSQIGDLGSIPFFTPLFDYQFDTAQHKPIWKNPTNFEHSSKFAADLDWKKWSKTANQLVQAALNNNRSQELSTDLEKFHNYLAPYAASAEDIKNQLNSQTNAVFPVHYSEGNLLTLPHHSVVGKLMELFQLRAIIALLHGDSSQARQYVTAILVLTKAINSEPFMNSCFLSCRGVELAASALQKGVDLHRWKLEDLAKIRSQFDSIDLVGQYHHQLRNHLGLINQKFLFVQQNRDWQILEEAIQPPILPSSGSHSGVLMKAIPAGWFFRNQLAFNERYRRNVFAGFPSGSGKIETSSIDEADENVRRELSGYSPMLLLNGFFSRIIFSQFPFRALHMKLLHQQINSMHASIVCGLESHWLAHGEYPSQLQSIEPRFLSAIPVDLMDGGPMKYKSEKIRTVIYSVGWNGRDDEGDKERRKSAGSASESPNDDWAWPLPATM